MSEALDVGDVVEPDETETEEGNSKDVVNLYLKTGENGSTTSDNKRKRAMSVDEHNDLCEVCETGGDLLCCDTCSLVFHLKCIRPKLSAVPKGHWSCARCIVDVWLSHLIIFVCSFDDRNLPMVTLIRPKRPFA